MELELHLELQEAVAACGDVVGIPTARASTKDFWAAASID